MEPCSDATSLRAQIASLEAELDSLRARYDTLLEAKNRAAERYKTDYKKWRDFKQWLFPDTETDDDIKPFLKGSELVAYTRASTLGKRKYFKELGPNLEHAGEEGSVTTRYKGHETEAHKQESVRDVKVERPRSLPVAVAFRHQRRKSYHGGSSPKVLLPSPGYINELFPAPHSTRHEELVDNIEVPSKAESSQLIPSTEPRKGRGRYAQELSGMDTINSRFSIRKDRNEGVDFQYDAVVRNREERKRMLGSDCECCREYYEAIEPLPASRQPLWRTPTKHKTRCRLYESDNDKENTDELAEHKHLISRHRHHWHRPKTPPGYWDIGFPDTQEVLDINRRAAEMHKRKLVDVETEAKNDNGRYVKRAPRTS